MMYKQDWEQAQTRTLAWWEGEIVDRPCLQITAPRDGMEQVRRDTLERPPDISLERWWTDIDLVVERTARRIAATYYGGEAFPLFNPNLGPDLFAAYLGAPLRFLDTNTNWVGHPMDDWAGAADLTIAEDNRWWRLQIDMLARAQAAGRGRWLTGIPDTHAGGDALSAQRGNARLCTDLYDHPDEVRAALRRLDELLRMAYERHYAVVETETYGSSSGWLPSWTNGRSNAVQCDFIALISPEQMENFILPSIVHEARLLDRAIFHVDGPDSLVHLDTLMAVPEIHAIQWVPGAGREPMIRWVPLLRRIQAAGKSLHISCSAAEVLPLLEALRPEGLMIATGAASEGEGRALLHSVARLRQA